MLHKMEIKFTFEVVYLKTKASFNFIAWVGIAFIQFNSFSSAKARLCIESCFMLLFTGTSDIAFPNRNIPLGGVCEKWILSFFLACQAEERS